MLRKSWGSSFALFLLILVLVVSNITYIGEVQCEDNLAVIYTLLKGYGFTDITAAALVGNVCGESGGNPACVEKNGKTYLGKGIGICQWSNDDRLWLEDYCATPEHDGHTKDYLKPDNRHSSRPKGYFVCLHVECQLAFALLDKPESIAHRLRTYTWSKYYNSQVAKLSVLSQAAKDGKIPQSLNLVHNIDGWKALSSLEAAVIQLLCDFYTPNSTQCFWVGNPGLKEDTGTQNSFITAYNTRLGYAKNALEKYAGLTYTPSPTVPGVPGSTDTEGGTLTQTGPGFMPSAQGAYTSFATQMYSAGWFDEASLQSFCALTETNIDDVLVAYAKIEDMRQADLESLVDWQRNNRSQKDEHGYIQMLRWTVVFVGIMLICWASLVYLAFWFDYINSFFYLDLLALITFGQLHICAVGDKPTFKTAKDLKEKHKTVSHFQVMCICLTAIAFGVFLVSGTFYTWIQHFVNLILGVVKK